MSRAVAVSAPCSSTSICWQTCSDVRDVRSGGSLRKQGATQYTEPTRPRATCFWRVFEAGSGRSGSWGAPTK